MNPCETCAVRNQAICSALDPEELGILNRIGRSLSMQKGQSLMWEGDQSLTVANIISGVFKLTSSLEDGREQIIGIAYPSDFVGRPFGDTNEYTVTALTDAKLCAFARSDFEKFTPEHPQMEHKLLEKTLDELDRARRWMLLLGRKTAPEKVASFLLEMSQKLGGNDCTTGDSALMAFELPFGRQQIADILGLTIETVSRQMTQMKKAGLIDLPDRRHVRILQLERLEDMSMAQLV
ncbi:MAG: Crp/Fnr family transcriptional regulator [Pseudomonadota bacterium]